MSPFFTITVLLAAILLPSLVFSNHEEDFAFDVTDDFEVELDDDQLGKWSNREIIANVGKTFHLAIPKEAFGGKADKFEVKRHNGKGIPSWLLFDRKGGIFWGIPLAEDVGTVHLTVRSTGDKSLTAELKITVMESKEDFTTMGKCLPNEDNTVLTLLIDKNVHAIKPRQRVIAVNNIAKFFGLPYSAFTLKPQIEKDDITDSSVVLAGPGNLRSKVSKATTLLQVPMGCDGHLWASTAPIVHQLKQQARDGTVAEVLRLPLFGWRVKTETRPVLRAKRQAVLPGEEYPSSGDYEDEYYEYDDDYDGRDNVPKAESTSLPKATVKTTSTSTIPTPRIESSGDYEDQDDYEYDDDYNEEDLGPVELVPPSPKATVTLPTTTISTTTASTTPTTSTVHPHRHHHGEVNPSATVIREHHQTTHKIGMDENMTVPVSTSTTTSTTTTEHATQPPPTTTTRTTTSVPTTVIAELPKVDPHKQKQGSEYDEYTYDYDDEDDSEDPIESETVVPLFVDKSSATASETESTSTESTTPKVSINRETVVENVPVTVPIPLSTTTIVSSTSTTTTSTTTTEQPTTAQIIEDMEPEAAYTTETEASQTTFIATTQQQTTQTSTMASVQTIPVSSTSTTTTTETPTTEEKTEKATTVRQVSTTPKTTTSITEVIEHHANFKPFIEYRLQQMSVIAGKIFRFVIPMNTFKDFEDEYNLTYELLDSNNKTVTNNTWLNFNAARRELYGLPLEEDVSKWVFWVKAYDREGASEKEKLNIQVQQHKLDLVVNHEFSLNIRIEKHQEFPHYVDWSLKVLRALGKIYNTNMSEITVRHINYTNEPVVFTWSNDSIATDFCPKTEIAQLYKTLTANDRGDPSRELNMALAPELRVKKVLYRELGVCEQPQTPVPPPAHPVTPPTNFSPILRNPVDNVNATVGELLVFKVKDDTFYDPEDVDPRMLNISLLTSDRKPIPPHNWLQFDNKNREFYGIPKNPGRSEYHLVCVDSGGLPATDSLEVVVYPAPKKKYNVEFSMNITEVDFVNNAALQKKFVEKLMRLFGDTNPSNIHIHSFNQSYNSTIVTWFNKSLTTETCPHDEIRHFESIVHNDNSISHRVHNVMEPDFRVSTIKVHLINNCQPKVIRDPRPEVKAPPEETAPSSSSDDYLITFILPAVIIAIMLFLAAMAACVLYRRRRTGKMNVEEDGRQSYGNKGIPVIFQEELEEKPEPGTKAPVILKDEKPPLAPPEYSKSGSVKLSDDSEPYQPPPPFTRTQDNGRQPRPKPTPTYRKPPPYVPP